MVYGRNEKKYGEGSRHRHHPAVWKERVTREGFAAPRSRGNGSRGRIGNKWPPWRNNMPRAGLSEFAKVSGIVYNAERMNETMRRKVLSDVRKVVAHEPHENEHCWNFAPQPAKQKSVVSQRHPEPTGATQRMEVGSNNSMFALLTTSQHGNRSGLREGGSGQESEPFPVDAPLEQISNRIFSALSHLTLRNDDPTTYSQAAIGLFASALQTKGVGSPSSQQGSHLAARGNNTTELGDSSSHPNQDVLRTFYNQTAPFDPDSVLSPQFGLSQDIATEPRLYRSLSSPCESKLDAFKSPSLNGDDDAMFMNREQSVDRAGTSPFSKSLFKSLGITSVGTASPNISREDDVQSPVTTMFNVYESFAGFTSPRQHRSVSNRPSDLSPSADPFRFVRFEGQNAAAANSVLQSSLVSGNTEKSTRCPWVFPEGVSNKDRNSRESHTWEPSGSRFDENSPRSSWQAPNGVFDAKGSGSLFSPMNDGEPGPSWTSPLSSSGAALSLFGCSSPAESVPSNDRDNLHLWNPPDFAMSSTNCKDDVSLFGNNHLF